MKFVHEFLDFPNLKNVDNGWWEYDPDTGKLYNRNGGWHDYRPHPLDEMVESTWEEIFRKTLRNDKYTTGWIAPDGTFFGCAPMDHIRLAKYYLDSSEEELEDGGWVKVYENPMEFCVKYGDERYAYFGRPTTFQEATLERLGVKL